VSWLAEFDDELARRRVRRRVRERLVAELADHLACEAGQATRLEMTRLGAAREIAGQCADELASDEGRRAALLAFAALALTGAALAATQTALGAIGYPGYSHGISTALSLPAILAIVVGSQIALVAGTLAAWRALRRRREPVLPAAEVALIATRTRVALSAGLAVSVSIGVDAANFVKLLPAWWLVLAFACSVVSTLALVGAWRAGARARTTLATAAGPAGDLYDDLPPLRALRGHPVRLWACLALLSGVAMTLFEWHAEHSLAEGLQRGIAEALAFSVCFAALSRLVGARR
jgi:hypothetical protein